MCSSTPAVAARNASRAFASSSITSMRARSQRQRVALHLARAPAVPQPSSRAAPLRPLRGRLPSASIAAGFANTICGVKLCARQAEVALHAREIEAADVRQRILLRLRLAGFERSRKLEVRNGRRNRAERRREVQVHRRFHHAQAQPAHVVRRADRVRRAGEVAHAVLEIAVGEQADAARFGEHVLSRRASRAPRTRAPPIRRDTAARTAAPMG